MGIPGALGTHGDKWGAWAWTRTRPRRDVWGHRGHGDTWDTPGSGTHRGALGMGTLGDTQGVRMHRAWGHIGHGHVRSHAGMHRDMQGTGTRGDTWGHAGDSHGRGRGGCSSRARLGRGLTGCPLAPTAGPGCWASVPFTAIPSRSAQHRPSGLRHRCHAWGGHGGGLRCVPHGARLSAQLRAASRAGPCRDKPRLSPDPQGGKGYSPGQPPPPGARTIVRSWARVCRACKNVWSMQERARACRSKRGWARAHGVCKAARSVQRRAEHTGLGKSTGDVQEHVERARACRGCATARGAG